MKKIEITRVDNGNREKAMAAVNAAVLKVEETEKRLNTVRSEIGTAKSEHEKALACYASARSKALRLIPEAEIGEADPDDEDEAAED